MAALRATVCTLLLLLGAGLLVAAFADCGGSDAPDRICERLRDCDESAARVGGMGCADFFVPRWLVDRDAVDRYAECVERVSCDAVRDGVCGRLLPVY